jgi:outer membrane protein OmpA-like peptidoglycan-associated protein
MRSLLAAAITLASGAAWAQSADLEQMWLDPAGQGSLTVGNGQTLKSLDYRVGASLFYTYGNLKSGTSPIADVFLHDRMGLQIFGAVGITNWLEVSANVPVMFYQRSFTGAAISSAGLGNPWLAAKFGLLDESKPVQLSAGVGVGIPVGTNGAMGNGGIEVAPRVTLGKVWSSIQLGVEVGGLLRPANDLSSVTHNPGDTVGSQLSLAAFAATVSTSGPRGEFSLRGFVPLTAGAAPGLEAQIGVRWPLGNVELFASAGPGFAGAPSTPSWRIYMGAAYGSAGLTHAPCVEGQPYELANCPDLDRDGDGISNLMDKCPTEPEDKDGFEDQDGCPDLDNDHDGVPDTEDKCPLVAGVKENHGCPDVDTDKDGIVDRLDKCPNEPEDKDGFEDQDGCPELDNDKDGIPDAKDSCPNQAGIAEEKGCPAKDSDGDGVLDFQDNCPTEKGLPENQGCPAAQKQLVVITREKLKILDKVYFDTGKATIMAKSNKLLDQVGTVLVAHPEIAKIQVEGYTDNVGNPEKNKKLSQERAEAVKTYLEKKGVAAARLVAVGFGEEKPAEPNTTPAGRDANRRVEFNVVRE